MKTLLLSIVESNQKQEYPLGFQFEILAALLRNALQKAFSQSITHSRMAITSLLIQMKLEGIEKTKAFELAGGIISLLHGANLLSAIEPDKLVIETIINTTIDQLLK